MEGTQARGANRFMWYCMAPVITFLIVVSLAPTIVAIIDSLRELSLTVFTKRGAFVGLENYRELLGEDGKFFSAIWKTVLFVLVVVPFEFAFGLAIALYINREFAGRRLIITLLMLPTMIAPVVVGMIWRYLLMPSFGLLTYHLQEMGFLAETTVFSDALTAFSALVIIDIWQWTPFMMLIMLAGLTSMPEEPIEAANLDGANARQVLWHVQIPYLRPLIIFAIMFRAIEASKVFDTIYILTGGGPGNATETIAVFAFRTTFIKWDLGYGAAICLVLAFFSLIVAAMFLKVTNRAQDQ